MKVYATSRISRRLGERLFLKAWRDASPKSAMSRRPYPPGMHDRRRRRSPSEFGLELVEKQKVRHFYGLTDGMLRRYVHKASKARGKTKSSALLELLERRLDNVVFRLGLAASRRIARNLVSYGYIALNGRPAKRPAILTKPGDRIAIHKQNPSHSAFDGLAVRLKSYQPPEWLGLEAAALAGTVRRLPTEADQPISQNLSKVIEHYSR